MDKPLIFFTVFMFSIIAVSAFVKFADAERFIPPTPAFKMINGTYGNVTALYYNSFATILNSSGILVDFDYSLNTITIGTSISGGGVNNTISSIGTQQSIVSGQINNDHQLKGIACGGDLQCSNNATDVTITFTDTGFGTFSLDDLTDVIITSPSLFSTLFYDGVNWIDKIFTVNSITCSVGQFVNVINNQTGETGCSTPSGSGNMTVLGDAGDVSISNPVSPQILFYNGTQWINKTFALNNQTVTANTFISGINNMTGEITTGVVTGGSGFTTIASEISPAGNATVLAYNNTGTRASFKTISAGQGIDVDNGTQSVIIKTDFKTNTATCSGTDKMSAYDNATGVFTCSTDQTGGSGGATILGGGNLTAISTASYTTIFSIPLTASSGNQISAYIIADSNHGGNSIQFMTNTTGANNWGTCTYFVPLTASTMEIDVLRVDFGAADTAGAAIASTNATTVQIQCSIYSTTSPGNLKINFQPEVTNQEVQVLPGSYYIKTP